MAMKNTDILDSVINIHLFFYFFDGSFIGKGDADWIDLLNYLSESKLTKCAKNHLQVLVTEM